MTAAQRGAAAAQRVPDRAEGRGAALEDRLRRAEDLNDAVTTQAATLRQKLAAAVTAAWAGEVALEAERARVDELRGLDQHDLAERATRPPGDRPAPVDHRSRGPGTPWSGRLHGRLTVPGEHPGGRAAGCWHGRRRPGCDRRRISLGAASAAPVPLTGRVPHPRCPAARRRPVLVRSQMPPVRGPRPGRAVLR